MSQTLLCVSFGTSVESARRSIRAVEQTLHETAPELPFLCAYTSPTIRRILQGRGETVCSLGEALDRLAGQEVIVQPTHLLYGKEYDQIRQEVGKHAKEGTSVRLGKPLLAGMEDLRGIAEAVDAAVPFHEGEALLLMGHGTVQFAGTVYPALQTIFRLMGREDVFVGTVEGWPTLDEILPQLFRAGYTKAHLMTLMLVAGEHARNDMAGDGPDSWRSRLNAAGIQTRCTLCGLGELPQVQALYRRHLLELLERENSDL